MRSKIMHFISKYEHVSSRRHPMIGWLSFFSLSVALFSKKKRHPSSLKQQQQQQQQQQNMRMLLLFFFNLFFFTRHLIIFKHLICDRLGAFNACPMWPPSVRAHVLHWEKSSGIWWNSFARSRFGCYLLRASSMPIPSMTFFFGCYFASQKNAKKKLQKHSLQKHANASVIFFSMCARAHWAQAALGKTNAICARWLMLTFIDGVACGRIREKTFISKGLWLFGGAIKPHKQQLDSHRLTVFSYSFYLREKAYFIHLLKINIWRCVAKKLYILSQNLNVIKLFEVFWSVFSPIFSECYFVCKKGTLHNLLAARTCANASLIFF